jgi:hypothetical protein
MDEDKGGRRGAVEDKGRERRNKKRKMRRKV